MPQSLFFSSLLNLIASCALVARADDGPANLGMPTALSGQGLQDVPNEPKAVNTFSNGHPQDNDGFGWGWDANKKPLPIPDLYHPRDIDIPFGRMYHGNISFFGYGQYNDPTDNTATWGPDALDRANQRLVDRILPLWCYLSRPLTCCSACGIPDDSSFQTKAAIHPYFLKYAGLDRK